MCVCVCKDKMGSVINRGHTLMKKWFVTDHICRSCLILGHFISISG